MKSLKILLKKQSIKIYIFFYTHTVLFGIQTKAVYFRCFRERAWRRVAADTAAGNRLRCLRRKRVQMLRGDLMWRSFVCLTKRMIIVNITVSTLSVAFSESSVRHSFFPFVLLRLLVSVFFNRSSIPSACWCLQTQLAICHIILLLLLLNV